MDGLFREIRENGLKVQEKWTRDGDIAWEIQLGDGVIDGFLIGRILEDYEIILIDRDGIWITKNIEKFVKQIGGKYKNGTWHILLDEYTVMYKGNLLDVSQVVNELIKYGFVRLNGEVIEFRIEEI